MKRITPMTEEDYGMTPDGAEVNETFYDPLTGLQWVNLQAYIPWYRPAPAAMIFQDIKAGKLKYQLKDIPDHLMQFINEHKNNRPVKMEVQEIMKLLKTYRFSLENEKELHQQIETMFIKHAVQFQREYRLSDQSVVDFFINESIAMEVKIKGRKREIYEQCFRYSEFDQVKEVLLVTRVSIGRAPMHDNKILNIVNLGSSWL